jgi:hypothetical protein
MITTIRARPIRERERERERERMMTTIRAQPIALA